MQYDSPSLQQEVISGMQKLQQVKRRFEREMDDDDAYAAQITQIGQITKHRQKELP